MSSTREDTLATHPFFTPWRDPQTDGLSYVLTRRIAPVQQAFYFVNNGVSRDERWLWFYAGFPPGGTHTLGVVSLDPDRPEIRHFPGAQFTAETPLVTADGVGCYFAHGVDVWLQPIEGEARKVASLPGDFVGRRRVHRLATHLTLSADGTQMLVDVDVGNEWAVALIDLASGATRIVKRFGRKYNHAQFSPVDPNLFLIAQDWWHDPITGQDYGYDWRTWIMTTDGRRFDPVLSQGLVGSTGHACHEWWASDGTLCWVDYEKGAMEAPDPLGPATLVWPRPLCHAHCDASRRFWCADQSPYVWHERPCEVLFFDRELKRDVEIASALPQPAVPRGLFHIDPHPQFSPRGTYVCYTTTALGAVDVALAPVATIREALARRGDGPVGVA